MLNPFLYAGELYDEESGLIYLRARYYDPNDGRFITKDTYKGQVDNPLSLNRYTYVYNNPLIHSDPTGNVAFPVSPSLTCAVDMANCKTNLDAQVTAGKKIATEGANFLIVDDINTLLDPTKSLGEKAYTAASLFPFAKVLKAAKVEVKINKAAKAIAKCNCFTAGTKVLTDEGEKPIEEIEVGDKVLAKDDETGKMAYKEVEWLFQRDAEETYNITVSGEVITTTDEHPFWIIGKGWVESKKLVVGDVLTTSEGKELAIEKIEVKKEHETVYNFKVKDFHTYFVSNLGIWTHNACGVYKWGNQKTLQDHFVRHGGDFGAKTPDEYAKKANDFFNNKKKYQVKTDTDGTIRVYDPKTNTFGSYNADGTTKTFYKPASPTYWSRQPGK
ncbi:polymorphic toxin-type HINT domain-containing protein [Brevibacillus laterosporus]|nr:polymorphic toxin-type HINT domain-containing protein [Brevibacillus laterosporus]MED1664847.1 polymorphic toxin-type HINT domain-containing protein [Brevibacillus laterosporus]MED1671429.1 polymorphic toxin-type HINT domain-containing protein [Brevibacillus laterosporus]MED1717542.1 polymorphic toxin-type HINT domain-containing protein [Brevibacillus laterosporus]